MHFQNYAAFSILLVISEYATSGKHTFAKGPDKGPFIFHFSTSPIFALL